MLTRPDSASGFAVHFGRLLCLLLSLLLLERPAPARFDIGVGEAQLSAPSADLKAVIAGKADAPAWTGARASRPHGLAPQSFDAVVPDAPVLLLPAPYSSTIAEISAPGAAQSSTHARIRAPPRAA